MLPEIIFIHYLLGDYLQPDEMLQKIMKIPNSTDNNGGGINWSNNTRQAMLMTAIGMIAMKEVTPGQSQTDPPVPLHSIYVFFHSMESR